MKERKENMGLEGRSGEGLNGRLSSSKERQLEKCGVRDWNVNEEMQLLEMVEVQFVYCLKILFTYFWKKWKGVKERE